MSIFEFKSYICQSDGSAMKILQLTKKFPFPLMDGESVAVHYLSLALKELGCSIDLLSMNTAKHHSDLSKLPENYTHYHHIHTVEVDNRVKVSTAFLNLFSQKSYHVSRFENRTFSQLLGKLLEENDYDIVLLETLYLTPYVKHIRQKSKARIVMRSHNLEFEIWERMVKNMSMDWRKLYLLYLVRKLKRYELAHLNVYDYLITVTQRDLSNFVKLGFKGQGMVVPIGIDTSDYKVREMPLGLPLRISFIGSLDWMPNMDGISWFLENIWDMYPVELAGIELHVAGRNTPVSFSRNMRERVEVHGEVDDAGAFISSCPVMIVPLFSGSGMRVKILEAMALERVVITTSLGLEGIEARHGEQVLIANTASDFVEQLLYCQENQEELIKIGKAARKLIRQKYDNAINANRLQQALNRLMLLRT